MEWQATPYTVPLLTAALVSFGLGAYVASQRFRGSRRLAHLFVGVAVGTGTWSLAYAAQLSVTTLDATLFWNRFVWVGVVVLAIAWPVFVLAYTNRTTWLRPRRLVALSAVPVLVLAIVWVSGPTGSFYRSPSMTTIDGYAVLSFTPGPALLAFISYTYTINLFTFVVLGHAAVRSDGVFRRQAALLLAAGIIPMGVGVAGIVGIVRPALIDHTPMAFSVTSVIVAWVLVRHRLLDIAPMARDTVFANLADGVVVADGTGRIVDVNESACELFPAIDVGQAATNAFEAVPTVAELVASGSTSDETRVSIQRGSETRIVSVSAHVIEGTGGHGGDRDGTVVLFRDVTERESLERRYRALIETSPNVIAVLGVDGLIRYVSPSVERLLGYEPAAVEGRSAIDFVHDDDRQEIQRTVEQAFETGTTQVSEHRFAHANGNWRTFETVVERLRERTDEVVITGTDVTGRRRYEQRLQVLNRVLRHDLKNDVNVISGYADLLRDHVDETGRTHLDVIDRKTRTLTRLSDQAREIDRALHSGEELNDIDLAELVPGLCDSLATSFPETTVTVSTPTDAVVRVDALIESAIRNVLENAVSHNDRESPAVDVVVDADGTGYRVVVRDDGPGVPDRERQVFSEGRETPLEHASGLGLWLVHWIVTESGGELEIGSREDRGTAVEIWLPAA
ncbi:histidine kinase N-terminal 7TM domain-containing protein [Halorubrum sp. DTA98]|uniref:histidine kinase N-terminal 7TM domain-containing protein n=1 Tax=Halorubrum sp. DTA98 TaxID=3402163 RepID=UPI003AABDAB4